MKKIITKKLSVSCIIMICLLFQSISVFAKEINGDMTYEEGAQKVVITDEMRQREEEKLNAFRNLRAYESYIKLNVSYFGQENHYYCGPATVKQVIYYVTKSLRTQDFYASKLGTTTDGTDMTMIPAVLNNYIDEDHYMYSKIGSQSEWLEKVRYSLHYGKPAVLDLNTLAVNEDKQKMIFPYDSTGHYVNVSGYDGSAGKIMITDPNDPSGNIWYSISDLYAANNSHFRKAIVW